MRRGQSRDPGAEKRSWTLKHDESNPKIPIFIYEDLELRITPERDSTGTPVRRVARDELEMYAELTWAQRSAYHTGMGWPEITAADIEETERVLASDEQSKIDAKKKIEEMQASGERARLDARTEVEKAEDFVKLYEGKPTLLTKRTKKMKVVDRVVLGSIYGWADEIPDHLTDEEIEHYVGLGDEEKKEWLELNEATDATENLRNSALEYLEGVKKAQLSKVVRKADYVRAIEREVGTGNGPRQSTTGFVGFRTWYGDDSEWKVFKDKVDEGVKKGWRIEAEMGSDPDDMLSRFEIRWIEDRERLEGKAVSEIRKHYGEGAVPWLADEQNKAIPLFSHWSYGCIIADKGAVDSVLHPPPEGPKSGRPGHKRESPIQKAYAGASKATGLPYVWLADSKELHGSDENEEDEQDEEDQTAEFFRICINDLDQFWLMTHDGAMGIKEMAPPQGEEYILASVV